MKTNLEILKAILEEPWLELGAGYNESVYQEAIAHLLRDAIGMEYNMEYNVDIMFLDKYKVGTHRLDFVVNEEVIVEVKTVTHIKPVHVNQLRAYKKTTGYPVGILVNYPLDYSASIEILEI